uniref:Protein kinase domain-containing protein n=1 Tax=Aegilops tauschii subsp. strangulata TaxID=200361 RepID=A0A453A9K5_AEGTS
GGAESCGDLVLPFPFHLNSSAACTAADGNSSSLFHLSCDGGGGHNATLTLTLGAAAFRVLEFLPTGASLLLDYAAPAAPPCDPAYAAFSRPSSPAAALDGAASFLAVAPANVLRLYACEDSSLCRAGCDDVAAPACAGKKPAAAGCCYPLSDGSVWKPGDGLGVFAGFGCRGFSSWVKNRSSATAGVTRAIEVEWAVPRGSALAACADGARLVNSTTVRGGVRCACTSGLVGDGFAQGTGCSKRLECGDGDGAACCQGRFCSKKAVALAGFFVSVFFLAAAVSFWLFLRQPSGDVNQRWDLDPACIPKILGGVCNARQFTYEQLDAATRRFEDGGQKPVDAEGAVHVGVLDDGTVVAVQRIGYETQDKLRAALDAVSLLPEVSHRNIARVVGFCLPEDPGARALLLVHEHFAGGTLEDHLRRTVGGSRATLGWHHRVNIAIELASALAYLQAHETAPTFLHDLRSSDVFLDADLTAKIAGHKLVSSSTPGRGAGAGRGVQLRAAADRAADRAAAPEPVRLGGAQGEGRQAPRGHRPHAAPGVVVREEEPGAAAGGGGGGAQGAGAGGAVPAERGQRDGDGGGGAGADAPRPDGGQHGEQQQQDRDLPGGDLLQLQPPPDDLHVARHPPPPPP